MLNETDDIKEQDNEEPVRVKRKGKGGIAATILKVCIIILVVILVLILVAAGVFAFMRNKGKNSLYENADNTGPSLPGLTFVEGTTTEPANETTQPVIETTSAEEQTTEDATTEADTTEGTAESTEASTTVTETTTAAQATTAPTTVVQATTAAPASDYVWQEGDVSYNGKIYRYNSRIISILILGIDSNSEIPVTDENTNYIKGGQSDAIFLAVLNPETKKLSLIAINRNTMTDIDVYDTANNYVRTTKAQICIQHGYGDGKHMSCERAKQTISELLYNLPIHGYCSVRLSAIGALNDAVGGVEVTLPTDMPTLGLTSGATVTLNGTQARQFLQYRDKYQFDSATTRLNNQKVYLTAFAKKVYSATASDITFPVKLYQQLSNYILTSMSVDEITYLASELLGYSFNEVKMYSVPGSTVMGNRFEEFYVDEAALSTMMLEIFYNVVG